ncbi:chloride channel protein [Nocardioides sp.]|uniref:chloride channel protein n=1 Tax=Nocardioides sp. TaxID=35761 RepID=UPI003783389D
MTRDSEMGLLVLALAVGAGAGLGAVAFRWLVVSFTRVFSGHEDYADAGRAAHPWFPGLGMWFVLLAPVVAGLVYGPLVHAFAREARGHGVPEVMDAVARRGGRIRPQVAVVKALASALCIGGGGSVGREGPIVQIGSALGSSIGRVVRAEEDRTRILVACGAAGGIAATFNAPLAGVFFAMELILADFAARSFGMVVLSSVTASVIGRAALGDEPFLRLPAFTVTHPAEYLLFALLGLLAGLVGVTFTRFLYLVEDGCDRAWRGPEWLRPAVGGLLLGAVLLVLPQMYGVGYPVLGNGVAGAYTVGFLIVLLLGKMVATSLTIGIGGSGGVFAPSLFIGAMLGAAYGQTAGALLPGVVGAVGAYGLIGMGAVFAGAARAPITAVVIMFELTGEYTIILPLMAAIVLATGVSHLISQDSVYTLKLRRRGVDLGGHPNARRLAAVTVADAMTPARRRVRAGDPLVDVLPDLAVFERLAVVDEQNRYLGVGTARAVTEALADRNHDTILVRDLVERVPPVGATQSIAEALDVLDRTEASEVPALDVDGRVVGWLTHRQVVGRLRLVA